MKNIIKRTYIFSFIILFLYFMFIANTSHAAIKISYNGKTYKYKKTQIKTRVDGKSVTAGKKKGILIKNNCMVSYVDIFKNGIGAKCTYIKSKKKLTIKANGATIKMTLGKKKAYVNGKSFHLPVAPTQVKYHNGNKKKILVPAKIISSKLKLSYSYSSKTGTITIKKPFKIKVGDTVTYYNNYKANFSFNNSKSTLKTIPGIRVGEGILLPANEISTILGYEYNYNSTTNTVTIYNKKDKIKTVFTPGNNTAIVNDVAQPLKVIPYIIYRYDTKESIVCIPAKFFATANNLLYEWDKNNNVVKYHTSKYFEWISEDKSFSSEKYNNSIYSVKSTYNDTNNGICFDFEGTSVETLQKITVEKKDKSVIVTIPESEYKCKEKEYKEFFEIIDNIIIEQQENKVIITINPLNNKDMDYAYSLNGNVFKIELLSGSYVGSYYLKIPKPEGLTFDMVSNYDDYTNKTIIIYLKGNYVNFFKENPVIINNKKVKSVTPSYNNDKTSLTIKCSSLQGFKIYDKKDSIVVNMDTPRKIYKKIVVLDAGHGGHDPGAVGNGKKEKDFNLLMMYTLIHSYFEGNAPEIKAYWTRKTDTFITLSDRAAYASKIGADIFVSLHMNSWSKNNINGTEVYYSSSNNKSSFSGLTSKKMANIFLKNLCRTMNTTNRGISPQRYTVVHKNTVPAVLLELGFISGSSDFPKLNNSTYQKNASKTIYDTIVQIFNSYPTGR